MSAPGMLRKWQLRAIGARGIGGYSLLELMISTTLGLVIMAGVVQMYVSSRTTQTAITGTSRVQENARYLFERFDRDVGRAGLLGCLPPWFTPEKYATGDRTNILNMLGKDAASVYNFENAVGGSEGTGLLGSDELVVRFMSSSGIPILADVSGAADTIKVDPANPLYANLNQWQLAVLADCEKAAIFIITNDPASGTAGEIKMALGTGNTAPAGSLNPGQYNECDFKNTKPACKKLTNDNGDPLVFRSVSTSNPMRVDSIKGQAAMLYSGTNVGAFTYSLGDSAAGTCSAAEPQFCALLVNGEEVVDGVEDFQVLFGEQSAANRLAYLKASDVSDWSQVRSVKVDITLNSVDKAGMDSATKGLYQQTFSRTFYLYNQKAP